MKTLSIDIETYSSVDLKSSGLYKYAESPDFAILLFAYSVDGGPVKIIDLAGGDEVPQEVMAMLTDPTVRKTAWNAAFERRCISVFFKLNLPVAQWLCTMAKAAQLGLPLSLDACAKALNLEEGKLAAGKGLIRYFSVPCKPTKTNGQRSRNLPGDSPDKWDEFKQYCIQDVVIEQAIGKRIAFFEFPASEKKLWDLDQKINDTGVLLDPDLIRNAIKYDLAFAEKLSKEAAELTGLDNPNSVAQLKDWMLEQTGEEVSSLNKESIPELLKNTSSELMKSVLELRQKMAKTSVKKYVAMSKAICKDQRFRGMVQYYGARTGRWAGRLVQVHNLPKNKMPDLELARGLVKSGDIELTEMCYANIPDTLSQLIRTAFIAPKGSRFIPSDFSAIEARVLAWLADEKWRLDVFNTHGKIYEASGAHMFKVPIEKVTKGSDLRDKAKIAELALGYQGAVNAMIKMGALKMGLQESELKPLVTMWRAANKKIVSYWYAVGEAAIDAVETGQKITIAHGISFYVKDNIFYIELPSGRKLSYQSPKLKDGKFGQVLTFLGVDKIWKRQETYGGKLVENIVQAVARDVLADAMIRVDAAGYKIVLHVHDEIVPEMPYGKGSAEELKNIMSQPIPWAKGLPLGADAYETEFYKKD